MTSPHNLQGLMNAKAALDLGLLNEEDYGRVKESFLKAQQLRAAIDAGLIDEGEQVEHARDGFVAMVLGASNEGTAQGSAPSRQTAKAPVPPAAMPPPPPMPGKAPAPPAPPPAAPRHIP